MAYDLNSITNNNQTTLDTSQQLNLVNNAAKKVSTDDSRYRDTMAPAKKETVDTKVPLSNLYDGKTELERAHEKICAKIDELLEQGNEDSFEQLQKVMQSYNSLMFHMCSQGHHDFIKEMNDLTKVYAEKIRKTYNTWPALTCTIVAATLQCVGGAASLAPIAASVVPIIKASSADLFAKTGQGIATVGSGVSTGGTIFNNKAEAERQVLQIELRRYEALHSEHKESRRDNRQTADRSAQQNQEHERTEAEIRRAMMA